METRAPRDAGDLETSIIKHPHKLTSERAEFDTGPNKAGFHGMFQELGTIDMSPQPFMRPTFDEDGRRAIGAVVKVLRRGVLRG
jgi:HK97 gp10 family phage protein